MCVRALPSHYRDTRARVSGSAHSEQCSAHAYDHPRSRDLKIGVRSHTHAGNSRLDVRRPGDHASEECEKERDCICVFHADLLGPEARVEVLALVVTSDGECRWFERFVDA